jgi:hypothetical protein
MLGCVLVTLPNATVRRRRAIHRPSMPITHQPKHDCRGCEEAHLSSRVELPPHAGPERSLRDMTGAALAPAALGLFDSGTCPSIADLGDVERRRGGEVFCHC